MCRVACDRERDELITGVARILSYWADSDLLYKETAKEIVGFCLGGKSLSEALSNLDRKSHEVL